VKIVQIRQEGKRI
jgi:hypothetical protein